MQREKKYTCTYITMKSPTFSLSRLGPFTPFCQMLTIATIPRLIVRGRSFQPHASKMKLDIIPSKLSLHHLWRKLTHSRSQFSLSHATICAKQIIIPPLQYTQHICER